jgi:LysR family hydrogen peroxide-inducible transcriptional activator
MHPLPVSLRQLQYLVAVADLGGFRKAADACAVAQPSLSAQVALAERALGVQVFERGRGVRVSAAGTRIVEQARRVLVAAGDLQLLARQLADPFQGTVRLGVIPTVAPYLLPEIAPALTRAFPRLAIVWTEERTTALMRQMEQGALDGAIVALEADLGDVEHVVLFRDPFVVAGAARHPLLRRKSPVDPRALEAADVLLLDDGHCFREQALGVCARAGARELGYRATSLATLVQMVSASSGLTLLPSMAVPVENRHGQLRVRPFASPRVGRTLALVWRRGGALRKSLEALAGAIKTAPAAGASAVYKETRKQRD